MTFLLGILFDIAASLSQYTLYTSLWGRIEHPSSPDHLWLIVVMWASLGLDSAPFFNLSLYSKPFYG